MATTFDIHQLKTYQKYDSKVEHAFSSYKDELIALFSKSPEGQAHAEAFSDSDIGFWVARLMDYGYLYSATPLPDMTVGQVEGAVTDYFPEKISIMSADDVKDTIPELIAFWTYLKREYHLPQSDAVLAVLTEIKPQFKKIMNDKSRWGIAKGFLTQAQRLGFDITDQAQLDEFVRLQNAGAIARQERERPVRPSPTPAARHTGSGVTNPRTQAEKSRRRNKKR